MELVTQGTDLPTTEALEVAARVRAAIAYSAQRVPEIAEKADIGVATLRRIISSTAPRGADAAELWRIADACDVPRQWVDTGWLVEGDPNQPPPTIRTEPHELGRGTAEQRLDVVERYLSALLKIEASRSSGELPLPPGSPPRRTRSAQAKRSDRPRLPRAADSDPASNHQS